MNICKLDRLYLCITMSLFLIFLNGSLSFSYGNNMERVIDEIIRECNLPNNSAIGRPLPLASHWNVGQLSGGYSPEYQIELLKKEYHILPWFKMPGFFPTDGKYYNRGIAFLEKYGLPFCLISTQWESLLSLDKEFFDVEKTINQNKIGKFGIEKKLNPLSSPTGNYLWYEAGKKWVTSPQLQKLQREYKNPPLVIFLSNNEHRKEKWFEIEDYRFMAYGVGQKNDLSNEMRRKIVGKAWLDKYSMLIEGMRENIESEAWKKRSLFVGYNSYGSRQIGKNNDWEKLSINVDGVECPGAFVWDGTSSSFYTTGGSKHVDYTFRGTLVEAMNYDYIFRRSLDINPNSWIEISIWEGGESQREYYRKIGQLYSPERYRGMVQYAMWLLRPRVVREFRHYDDTVKNSEPYFFSVLNSIEFVYKSEVLEKFWRNGVNVVNDRTRHPYDNNVPDYIEMDRMWFLLDNDVNISPVRNSDDEIYVYNIALCLGKSPDREWLVYSFSPKGGYERCKVRICEDIWVSVNSSQTGTFSHIIENKDYDVKEISDWK